MVQPGCGPPFLTPKEFERKFGVSPRIRTDEELTRNYDSVGMYCVSQVASIFVAQIKSLLHAL